MIKLLLLLTALFFSACVNKHGISAKYYSGCDEYYDLQGYYHKECGKDDIVTYKAIGEATSNLTTKIKRAVKNEEAPKQGNVW